MKTHDAIVLRRMAVIEKVLADELWLESERRGCAVARNDPLVRENVCRAILRLDEERKTMGSPTVPGWVELQPEETPLEDEVGGMPTLASHHEAA